MRNFLALRRLRLWLIVAVGTLLVAVVYFGLFTIRKPLAPTVPIVSSCKNLAPGMRRIGDRHGFQFDVPSKEFNIHEGATDAPPLMQGFGLIPKNGTSELEISFPHRPMESMALDPARTFSSHFERRRILDDQGHPLGEDYWGYLESGERWRQVRLFKGGIVAKYGFVDKKQAELFDRVISSACLLSDAGQLTGEKVRLLPSVCAILPVLRAQKGVCGFCLR